MSDKDVGVLKKNIKYLEEALEPSRLAAKIETLVVELEGLQKVSTKAKFIKNIKAFGSLVKTIGKTTFQGWAMEQLMTLLKPFLGILKLFTPIFKVLASIFQKALMPVIQALLPIIMFFVELLQQFSPIIEEIIGQALTPVIEILGFVMEFLTENQDLFDMIFNAIQMIVEVIGDLLEELLSTPEILIAIKAIMFALRYVIIGVVFVIKIFVFIVKVVANVIRIVIKAIRIFIGWIIDLIELFGGGKGGKAKKHQAGGIFTAPSLGIIGEAGPEAVVPLDELYLKFDLQLNEQSATNAKLDWLIKDKMFRHRREE